MLFSLLTHTHCPYRFHIDNLNSRSHQFSNANYSYPRSPGKQTKCIPIGGHSRNPRVNFPYTYKNAPYPPSPSAPLAFSFPPRDNNNRPYSLLPHLSPPSSLFPSTLAHLDLSHPLYTVYSSAFGRDINARARSSGNRLAALARLIRVFTTDHALSLSLCRGLYDFSLSTRSLCFPPGLRSAALGLLMVLPRVSLDKGGVYVRVSPLVLLPRAGQSRVDFSSPARYSSSS